MKRGIFLPVLIFLGLLYWWEQSAKTAPVNRITRASPFFANDFPNSNAYTSSRDEQLGPTQNPLFDGVLASYDSDHFECADVIETASGKLLALIARDATVDERLPGRTISNDGGRTWSPIEPLQVRLINKIKYHHQWFGQFFDEESSVIQRFFLRLVNLV